MQADARVRIAGAHSPSAGIAATRGDADSPWRPWQALRTKFAHLRARDAAAASS